MIKRQALRCVLQKQDGWQMEIVAADKAVTKEFLAKWIPALRRLFVQAAFMLNSFNTLNSGFPLLLGLRSPPIYLQSRLFTSSSPPKQLLWSVHFLTWQAHQTSVTRSPIFVHVQTSVSSSLLRHQPPSSRICLKQVLIAPAYKPREGKDPG